MSRLILEFIITIMVITMCIGFLIMGEYVAFVLCLILLEIRDPVRKQFNPTP